MSFSSITKISFPRIIGKFLGKFNHEVVPVNFCNNWSSANHFYFFITVNDSFIINDIENKRKYVLRINSLKSNQFNINEEIASKAFKDIYKNYKQYTLNAKKLAIVNKGKFSLAAMNKKFENILDQYLPKFEESNSDILLIATEGDRCDLLSSQYYGSAEHWWFVASVNKLSSNNIPAGTQLRIPVSLEQAKLR